MAQTRCFSSDRVWWGWPRKWAWPSPSGWGQPSSVLNQTSDLFAWARALNGSPALPHLQVTLLSRPLSSVTASLSQVPEDDERKECLSSAEQVICLSVHFVFLHKSCISLFLLPLASEQFLIIRKVVFSAMNHQTVNKEFKSAAESGRAKHLKTGLRKCSQIVSVGEILLVALIIISNGRESDNVRHFIKLCTMLHVIIITVNIIYL